jgi:hypothetical protein
MELNCKICPVKTDGKLNLGAKGRLNQVAYTISYSGMHGPKPNSALRSLCSPAVGQPLEVTATQRSIALLSNNLTLISSQVDPPFLCCRRRRCPVSSSRTLIYFPSFASISCQQEIRMGLSQEEVIALLKQHGVDFQTFEHAPVMTVEAQVPAAAAAAAVGV